MLYRMSPAIPGMYCAVLLISSCMQFWFANVFPGYLNFGSFSIYQLSSCCALRMHSVHYTFTSRPTSSLASNNSYFVFFTPLISSPSKLTTVPPEKK